MPGQFRERSSIFDNYLQRAVCLIVIDRFSRIHEILIVCDGASWHKSYELKVPSNIHLAFIPPYTSEMNPIEQIWKEIRKMGFRKEIFHSLEKVVDRLCLTINNIPADVVHSITARDWIISCFIR